MYEQIVKLTRFYACNYNLNFFKFDHENEEGGGGADLPSGPERSTHQRKRREAMMGWKKPKKEGKNNAMCEAERHNDRRQGRQTRTN